MIVRGTEPSSRAIAVANVEQIWLHRSLFEAPPFDTTWLAVRRDDSATGATAAVRRSLGTDLATTLLGEGLPPHGRDVVRATLDIANSVRSIRPISVAATRADGYRLEVDAGEFADEAPLPDGGGAPSGETSQLLPVLDAWVTPRGDVVRVEVRPVGPDGTVGAPEEGWRLDFGTSAGISTAQPGAAESTAAASIDADELLRSKEACRLPV